MSLPVPKLDDKTFAELFEEARSLIPRYAPEWTDYNISDPGITLIDLFAWLAEMQIYSLDQLTDKNFQTFLKLLDIIPEEAKAASADISFEVLVDIPQPVSLPAGTQVVATDVLSGREFVFETGEDLKVLPLKLKKVLTFDQSKWIDNTDNNHLDNVFYFAFGETAREGSQLYLGIDPHNPVIGEPLKLMVTMYETDLPPISAAEDEDSPAIIPPAEVEWEYRGQTGWLPLEVSDGTAAFFRSGPVEFTFPENIVKIDPGLPHSGDVPLYWIRITIKEEGYEILPRIDTILPNTVTATHGKTYQDELHSGSGLPGHFIELFYPPVLSGTLILEILEPDSGWMLWSEVQDFNTSGPEDRHYIVDLQTGIIRFGDGIHGSIPPLGPDNIRAVQYRSGGGEAGNLQAGMLKKLADPVSGIKLTHRKPASGGKDPETLPEALERARRDLKRRSRTVTSEDFETLALSTPGVRIARVKVLPLYHPDYVTILMPGAVTIVVVPYILPDSGGLPKPGEGLLRTVFNYLEPKRLATTNLFVIGPEFIEVSVTVSISIDSRMSPETARLNVSEALQNFLDPLSGGAEGTGWPFGRTVFKSEIYQVIENVDGITCVNSLSLASDSCVENRENIKIPRVGLVYSGKHNIEVN